MRTNCYHTRDGKGVKLTGGMCNASTYEQAAQRAAHGLTIAFANSGMPIFQDKTGREVSLYLSVHPEHLSNYPVALAAYQETKRKAREAAEREEEQRPVDETAEAVLP